FDARVALHHAAPRCSDLRSVPPPTIAPAYSQPHALPCAVFPIHALARALPPLFPTLRLFFFFSSRRRHTRSKRDWSSDVCSSDLGAASHRSTVRRYLFHCAAPHRSTLRLLVVPRCCR